MKKTISILFMVVVLLANIATFPVLAATLDASATISADSVSPGETVEVFFAIDAPAGIKTLSFYDFTYDNSVFEIIEDESASCWLVDGKIEDIDIANNASVITFEDNIVLSGNVLKLSFKVSDNAPKSEYPISCSVVAMKMVDGVETKINVTITSGKITVAGKATPLSDFEYEIVDGGICILSYTGSKNSVIIDESYEVDGTVYNVVEIAESAFETNSEIVSVTIPSKVKKIGDYAFYDCTSLLSVTIYSTDAVIGENALGYYYISRREDGVVEGFTIYGYAGSTAQEYASADPDITFVELSDVIFEPINTTVFATKDGINYIYGLEPRLEISSFESLFVSCANVILEYRSIKSNWLVTDSTVVVKSLKTGEVVSEYKVVIFGDVNKDGWYDGQDAVMVDCIASGMLKKSDVSEAVYMAADSNHDGAIDQSDVEILNQAGTLLAEVDQSKKAEELFEASSSYVEYLELIDQSPEAATDDNEQPEDENNDDQEIESTITNKFVVFILDIIAALKFIFDFVVSLFKR